jgi:hypothetical protein
MRRGVGDLGHDVGLLERTEMADDQRADGEQVLEALPQIAK